MVLVYMITFSFSYPPPFAFVARTHARRILVWIDRIIDGNRDATSAGLLEECILDDDGDDTADKCRRFESALTRLDDLLGVGAKEQY